MKRIVSLLLILTLLPITGSFISAEAAVVFTDIPDAETQTAADFLYRLGIVKGTGGTNYSPGSHFSRAELAVIGTRLTGLFDVSTYGGVVRFPDVRANHWAHRWVNAASSPRDEQPAVMSGSTDGNFYPEDPMLYGHLITVLMKLLGYSDEEVGFNWPHSYIAKAEALGISSGMSFTADQIVTRGEAARLIYHFLFVPRYRQTDPYMVSKFGVIPQPAVRQGELVTLLLDKNGNILAAEPDKAVAYRTVNVAKAYADRLVLTDNSVITGVIGATLWDGEESGVYSPSAFNADGETVTLITRDGKLEHILRGISGNKKQIVLSFETVNGVTTILDGPDNGYIYNGALPASHQGKLASLTVNSDGYVTAVDLDNTVSYKSVTVSSALASWLSLTDGSIITGVNGADMIGVWDWDGSVDTYAKRRGSFWAEEDVTLVYRGNTLLYILRDSQERKSGGSSIITILRTNVINGILYALTDDGEYPVKDGVDASLRGRTGKLLIDKEGIYAVGFTVTNEYTYQTVTVSGLPQAGGFQSDSGYITVPANTEVWDTLGYESYRDDLFGGIWTYIRPGEELLLARDQLGRLKYIYRLAARGSGEYQLSVLEKQPEKGSDPLTAAFGRAAAGAALYKNGFPATLDMLDRWDVLLFYEGAGVVEAYNVRISGVAETGYPLGFESAIKLFGESFTMLKEAQAKIGQYNASQRLTYLLSYDGLTKKWQIADVRPSGEVSGTTSGLVSGEGDAVSAGSLPSLAGIMPSTVRGRVGTFYSSAGKQIFFTPFVMQSGGRGELDLAAKTLGSSPIAPWCAVYDQAGVNGRAVRVSDIPSGKIPAAKVLYAETSPSGYVTTLVLDNITGDAYQYGYAYNGIKPLESLDGTPNNANVMIVSPERQHQSVSEGFLINNASLSLPSNGAAVGIAAGNLSDPDFYGIVNEIVNCVRYDGFSRFDFNGSESLAINGKNVPIAAGAGVYIPSMRATYTLEQSRALCTSFEVYTDPWGHKVRLIIGIV